jgi:hypothetical protein
MNNRKNLYAIVLGIFFLPGTMACKHTSQIAATPTISFSQSIVPIFTASCIYGTGCHATANSANQNIGLDTPGVYANLFAKGLINTSTPQASLLYGEVSGGAMPKAPYQALTASQQSLILDWIEQGAKNN